MFKMRIRHLVVALALVVLAICLPGCGGGGGGTATGLAISSAQVLPTTWSSGGGNAAIESDITDSVPVTSATAVVTLPGGGTASVTLTQSPAGSVHYTGQYPVPANTGTAAQTYSVVISATDASQTVSASAIQFTISAPGTGFPPEP